MQRYLWENDHGKAKTVLFIVKFLCIYKRSLTPYTWYNSSMHYEVWINKKKKKGCYIYILLSITKSNHKINIFGMAVTVWSRKWGKNLSWDLVYYTNDNSLMNKWLKFYASTWFQHFWRTKFLNYSFAFRTQGQDVLLTYFSVRITNFYSLAFFVPSCLLCLCLKVLCISWSQNAMRQFSSRCRWPLSSALTDSLDID